MSAKTKSNSCAQPPRGIMTRLAKDKRGATLPMMAAAIIPIAAMVGAGLDMSRVVLVRTRLQQACDAGAVAVRRSMSATNSSTTTLANKAEGYKFFDFNFPADSYGANSVTRSYVGTPGANGVDNVAGTASAILPTAIMKLFAVDTLTISTSCAATVSIPNTDVMFVLDISGSMNDKAVSTDTQTKIQALKTATKNFYLSLGAGSATGAGRIRYGFVPYSSQVNVGAVVKAATPVGSPSYIMGAEAGETATYRSRKAHTYTENFISGYSSPTTPSANGSATDSTPSGSSWSNYGTSGTTSIAGTAYTNKFTGITQSVCNGKAKPYPLAVPVNTVDTTSGSAVGPIAGSSTTPTYPDVLRTNPYTTTQDYNRSTYGYVWSITSGSGSSALGTCQFRRLPQTFTRTTPTKTTQNATWDSRPVADYWTYDNVDFDVSSLVAGNTVANPTFWTGTSYVQINNNPSANKSQANISSTHSWGGCLEESSTVNWITAGSDLTIPDEALDMKIDLRPTDALEKWRPFLPSIVYDPTGQVRWQDDDYWNNNKGMSVCPTASKKMIQYTTLIDPVSKLSAPFRDYVDLLTPRGTTQHDIGMIWGARFMSPNGILASENDDGLAPGGFATGRHIVFMTDGLMNAQNDGYSPWGISRLDGRQVPTTTLDSSNGSTAMNDIHNHRLVMICNAARSKGMTIWVIGFGMTASTMPDALKDCAGDSDHWMAAPTAADLDTKFKDIASTIGGLRLTQ
jgi:Flp pilus assembly protein TadG